MGISIKLTIGGKEYTATLNDNRTKLILIDCEKMHLN